MPTELIRPPFPQFRNAAGAPLNNGYVYFGTAGADPVTNQITVYWDRALTIPASQPIRTVNGYLSRGGSPARVFTNVDYSVQSQNAGRSVIYTSLSNNVDSIGDTFDSASIAYNDTTVKAALDMGRLDSVATLKLVSYSTLSDNDKASTLGYYAEGDGGANDYFWDAASTETETLGSYFKAAGQTTEHGRWVGVFSNGVYVKQFGVVGDGVTDDTTGIQAAVDAAESVGGTVLFPPSSSPYVMGKVTIGSSDGLILDGNGQGLDLTGTEAGFWLSGTISNLTIKNFRATGDGTSASAQALVQNNSGQTLSRIKVLDNDVTETRNGIALTAESGGSILDVEYAGNYVSNTHGTLGGNGYGLFLSGPNNTSIRGNIHHNWIDKATRHSIYVSRGDDVNISDNIISNHRQSVADLSIRAAIASVRGSNRSIKNNIFINTFDGCLNVNADTAASGAITRNNFIGGNHFLPNGNDIAQVYIGSSDPATDDGILDDIVIFDNKFYPGANTTNALQLDHGKKILVSENKFFIDKAVGYACQFTAQGESGGSTTYSSGWDLFDNRIELNGTTSAAFRSVPPFVADSSMTVRFKRNDIIKNGASSVSFSQSASISGPTVEIAQMDQSGIISSTAPTEPGVIQFADLDSSPSVNNAVMGFTNNTGATSFSTMVDGRIGQRVTVVFNDSNTVVDFTGTNLKGNAGVDWGPTAGESMTCDFDGTNWTCTIREI